MLNWHTHCIQETKKVIWRYTARLWRAWTPSHSDPHLERRCASRTGVLYWNLPATAQFRQENRSITVGLPRVSDRGLGRPRGLNRMRQQSRTVVQTITVGKLVSDMGNISSRYIDGVASANRAMVQGESYHLACKDRRTSVILRLA